MTQAKKTPDARPPTPVPQPEAIPWPYVGLGQTPITKAESEALMEEFADDEIDVLPTSFGAIYVTHVYIRRRLNKVLGTGQWCELPVGPPEVKGKAVTAQWALLIRGRFISTAWGMKAMTAGHNDVSDSHEAAKSQALTRNVKALSVGWRCWEKAFANEWRDKHCVKRPDKDRKMVWYLKSAAPADYTENGDGGPESDPGPSAAPQSEKVQQAEAERAQGGDSEESVPVEITPNMIIQGLRINDVIQEQRGDKTRYGIKCSGPRGELTVGTYDEDLALVATRWIGETGISVEYTRYRHKNGSLVFELQSFPDNANKEDDLPF